MKPASTPSYFHENDHAKILMPSKIKMHTSLHSQTHRLLTSYQHTPMCSLSLFLALSHTHVCPHNILCDFTHIIDTNLIKKIFTVNSFYSSNSHIMLFLIIAIFTCMGRHKMDKNLSFLIVRVPNIAM